MILDILRIILLQLIIRLIFFQCLFEQRLFALQESNCAEIQQEMFNPIIKIRCNYLSLTRLKKLYIIMQQFFYNIKTYQLRKWYVDAIFKRSVNFWKYSEQYLIFTNLFSYNSLELFSRIFLFQQLRVQRKVRWWHYAKVRRREGY